MKISALSVRAIVPVFALSVLCISNGYAADKKVEILNASYDVARELFEQINPAFAAEWKSKTGATVVIKQSHGGSTRQARAVLEGLPADVVTFNQFTDIQVLQTGGYVGGDWQQRLPDSASPYYSFPAFLVRAGNPKKIHDWNDLVRANVQSIFPNPKTSGNGRYTYLGAYAYALEQFKGDKTKANEFVKQFLANVPVFDTGGRGATTTFVEREIGDVLVTFESEVNGIRREYGDRKFEVVIPSISVQADFPVAVVDKVALRHGTRDVANAYLQFLYSAQGQEILAKNFNRVRDPQVAQRYQSQFPTVRLVTIDQVFGGWATVTKTHFANGGLVDQALAR
jgi:sulfate transport system substrate-binding protein